MSVRESIQQYPGIASVAAVIIIIIALAVSLSRVSDSELPGAPAKTAYYSTDDGASWFADDINKIPPFQKDGKEAARAYIFRCGNDKPFVAYLMRYTPEGKKLLEAGQTEAMADPGAPPDEIALEMVRRDHGQVKKPMDPGNWLTEAHDSAAYAEVMKLSCPSGNMNDLQFVMP